MPELDDRVKLYFPTDKEEEGVVINSIRRRIVGGDYTVDPEIKFFRTKFGKELMFSENEIMITGKDDKVLIRLIGKEGEDVFEVLQTRGCSSSVRNRRTSYAQSTR